MRLQFCEARGGLFLAAFFAFGCTFRALGTSPSEPTAVSRTKAESSRLSSWKVIDHAARWATKVSATSEPELLTHPGYVHVSIDIGDENRANCFVYDSPIVTGQAVLRLLRAAESGIEFKNVSVLHISEVANNPFVSIQAEYTTTMPPVGVDGVLQLSVSPRVSHPVVCSQERLRASDRFLAFSTAFLENMTPTTNFGHANLQAGEMPLVDEYWVYETENGPIGFRNWRARRLGSGQIASLELSSLFEIERGELQATDTRVLEYDDEIGLLAAEWLSVVNGDHKSTVTLRRKTDKRSEESGSSAFEYQFRSMGGAGPSEGTFSSDRALLSTYGAFLLARAQTGAVSLMNYRYVPPSKLSGPTEFEWRGGDGSAAVRVGAEEFRVEFAEDGLPRARADRTNKSVWRLYSRHQHGP